MRDRIFISYRRSDSRSSAEAVNEVLSRWFGDDVLFKDTVDIDGGDVFPDRLRAELGRAAVVVAVIGPTWLGSADDDGHRRLDDPDDWVRRELATSLASPEVRVIPLLLDGAGMPSTSDLPVELGTLPLCNAVSARIGHLRQDLQPLRTSIEKSGVVPGRGPDAVPLGRLVKALKPGGLLAPVCEWDPYSLGSTRSNYGDAESYGERDTYVPRTANDFDARLRHAMKPGRLVLVEGGSKVGKSRSVFEAARATWADAIVVQPRDGERLSEILRGDWPELADRRWVLWLDEIDRYLIGTQTIADDLQALLAGADSVLALATIRPDLASNILSAADRLSMTEKGVASAGIGADAANVLRLADRSRITLSSTAADTTEQQAAQITYQNPGLTHKGLGEFVSGSMFLAAEYERLSGVMPPTARAVVEAAVDWERCGMTRPIAEPDLVAIVTDRLERDYPDRQELASDVSNAVADCRTRIASAGHNALLVTELIEVDSAAKVRAYRAFPFLVASDDGQGGSARPIPDDAWNAVTLRGDGSEMFAIGLTAYNRSALEAATTAFGAAAERFGTDESSEVRVQVAKALFNKGAVLGVLGRSEDEVGVYDEVVARFGGDESSEVREVVARVLVNKGAVLGVLGRSEDEVGVFDEVVARFGGDESSEVRVHAARALVNKGATLGELGRPEDEIEVYDEVVARFGGDASPDVREQVARALFNTGLTFGELGRPEDEVGTYHEVVARFGGDSSPDVRVQVAMALVNTGVTFGVLGRPEDVVGVCDEVVARFGGDESSGVRVQLAMALVNKGVALGVLGRPEDEVGVYDEVVARFGSDESSEVRVQVAMALVNKGWRLGVLGRPEDAVEAYDGVVARFGGDESSEVRVQVAMALVNKGVALGVLGRPEDEVEVYDEVVARFGGDGSSAVREVVARALVNKGAMSGELGRPEDAVGVYDEVVARFGGDALSEVRVRVAMALFNKGVTLGELGRTEDAISALDDLLEYIGSDDSPDLVQMIADSEQIRLVLDP